MIREPDWKSQQRQGILLEVNAKTGNQQGWLHGNMHVQVIHNYNIVRQLATMDRTYRFLVGAYLQIKKEN